MNLEARSHLRPRKDGCRKGKDVWCVINCFPHAVRRASHLPTVHYALQTGLVTIASRAYAMAAVQQGG